jgi:hypothetical protein
MSTGQVDKPWTFQVRKCRGCGELFKVDVDDTRRKWSHCDKCIKQCPDCNRQYPLTEDHWYWKARRNAKGEWCGYWDTYCRKCKIRRNRERAQRRKKDPELLAEDRSYYRAKRKEYRDRNPEKDHEYNVRRWQRIQSDPQAYEDYILNRRAYRLGLKEFDPNAYVIACQDARMTPEGERSAKKQRTAVGAYRPTGQKLNAAPFRKWVAEQFPDESIGQLAWRFQYSDAILRRLLDPKHPDYGDKIDIRTVDRILVNIGRPDVLNELYPV